VFSIRITDEAFFIDPRQSVSRWRKKPAKVTLSLTDINQNEGKVQKGRKSRGEKLTPKSSLQRSSSTASAVMNEINF
jgi:hypothetical protein